jgi:hypothetical protein
MHSQTDSSTVNPGKHRAAQVRAHRITFSGVLANPREDASKFLGFYAGPAMQAGRALMRLKARAPDPPRRSMRRVRA